MVYIFLSSVLLFLHIKKKSSVYDETITAVVPTITTAPSTDVLATHSGRTRSVRLESCSCANQRLSISMLS